MSKSGKRTFSTMEAANAFQASTTRRHNHRSKPPPPPGPSPRRFAELRNTIRAMQKAVGVRQATVDARERSMRRESVEIVFIKVESESKKCIVSGCNSDGNSQHRAFKGRLCDKHLSHASRPTPQLFECACHSCEVVLDCSNPIVCHVMGRIRLCPEHMKLQHDKEQCPHCPLMCKAVGRSTCVNCRAKGIKRRK